MVVSDDPLTAGPATASHAQTERVRRPEPAKPVRNWWLLGATCLGASAMFAGGVWLARKPLTALAVEAVLAGRGVEAEIDVRQIGPSGLELGQLRLGSIENPTIVLESAHAQWFWNTDNGRMGVRVSSLSGLKVNIALGKDGLDLGELGPLLEGDATGRSAVFVETIKIDGAELIVATQRGPIIVKADVAGSQGNVQVTGSALLAQTLTGATGSQSVPLSVVVRQIPKTGIAGPATVVGFDARPESLFYNRDGVSAGAVTGRLAGGVRLESGHAPVITLKSSQLKLGAFSGFGLTAANAGLDLSSLTWTQADLWQTQASFALDATLTADRVSYAGVTAGAVRLPFKAARSRDAALTATYDFSAGLLSVPGGAIDSIGLVGLQGTAEGLLPDISAPGDLSLGFTSSLALSRLRLAKAQIATLPEPLGTVIGGPVAVQGQIEGAYKPGRLELGLAAPLQFSGIAHSGVFRPDRSFASGVVFETSDEAQVDGSWSYIGGLRGDLEGSASGGSYVARIETARIAEGLFVLQLGPLRWDRVQFGDLLTSGLLQSGNLALVNGRISGQGAGSLSASGRLPDGSVIDGLSGQFSGQVDADRWQGRFDGRIGRFASRVVDAGNSTGMSVSGVKASASLNGSHRTDGTMLVDIGADATAETLQFGATRLSQATLRSSGQASSGASLFEGQTRFTAGRLTSPDLSSRDIAVSGPVSIRSNNGGPVRIGFDLDGRAGATSTSAGSAATSTVRADGALVLEGATTTGIITADFVLGDVRQGTNRVREITFSNRFALQAGRGGFSITSQSGCLPARLSGITAGEGTIGQVGLEVCPEPGRPLLSVGGNRTRLALSANISPLDLQLAANADLPEGLRQSLRLGPSRLRVVDSPQGQRFVLSTTSLEYLLPLEAAVAAPGPVEGASPAPELSAAPRRLASVSSNDANVEITPGDGGVSIVATLNDVNANGLPVTAQGSATANLLFSDAGLTGSFTLDGIAVSDPQADPAFGNFLLVGSGTLAPDIISLSGQVSETRTGSPVAALTLNHVISTARGGLTADLDALLFKRGDFPGAEPGLQPSDISPRLRGLIVNAMGDVAGTVGIAWDPQKTLQTGADLILNGLTFSTLAGPVTGLSGRIAFADLLTQRTDGVQTITIAEFNPGVPMLAGQVGFSLPGNNSLTVDSAAWPFAGGRLYVEPTTLLFSDPVQRFDVQVAEIDLNRFLRLTEIKDLEVTGTASGRFPMVLEDGVAAIRGGYLEADGRGGGVRYTGVDPSPPPPPRTWWQRLTGQPPPPPQGIGLAVAALRNLDYRVLRVTVDGRLTGDIDVGVALEGNNTDVLSGVPFKFKVNANVPFGRLLGLRRYIDPQFYWDMTQEAQRLQGQSAAPAPLAATPQPGPVVAPPSP